MRDHSQFEEYQKRKAAAAHKIKERWTLKDWITVGLSVCAFGISSTTAYYSSLRVVDEVRVVVDEIPIISVDFFTSSITFRGDASIVLINAGTRPVAIRDVALEISEVGTWNSETSDEEFKILCERGTRVVESGFEAVVLKEKEIVRRAVQFQPGFEAGPGAQRREDGSVVLAIPEANSTKRRYRAVYCLRFAITTPSISSVYKRVPMSIISESGGGGGGGSLSYKTKPFVLLKDAKTIFTAD